MASTTNGGGQSAHELAITSSPARAIRQSRGNHSEIPNSSNRGSSRVLLLSVVGKPVAVTRTRTRRPCAGVSSISSRTHRRNSGHTRRARPKHNPKGRKHPNWRRRASAHLFRLRNGGTRPVLRRYINPPSVRDTKARNVIRIIRMLAEAAHDRFFALQGSLRALVTVSASRWHANPSSLGAAACIAARLRVPPRRRATHRGLRLATTWRRGRRLELGGVGFVASTLAAAPARQVPG